MWDDPFDMDDPFDVDFDGHPDDYWDEWEEEAMGALDYELDRMQRTGRSDVFDWDEAKLIADSLGIPFDVPDINNSSYPYTWNTPRARHGGMGYRASAPPRAYRPYPVSTNREKPEAVFNEQHWKIVLLVIIVASIVAIVLASLLGGA